MNTSKKLSKSLLLVFIIVGVVSCQNEPLSVSPMSDLVFGYKADSVMLKVSGDVDWSISASSTWVEITNKTGGEGDVIMVKVPLNQSFYDRKCVLNIHDSGYYNEIQLNITQKGNKVLGAWSCEHTQYTRFEDDVLIEDGVKAIPVTLVLMPDGSFVRWEKDGFFWEEKETGLYSVEDDMLYLESADNWEEYSIIHLDPLELVLVCDKEYLDGSTMKNVKESIRYEFYRNGEWVAPEEGLLLKDYSATLYAADTFRIISNGKDVSYRSKNQYVANVDGNGLITANFVGETIVEVLSKEGSTEFFVDVEPRYSYCKEPTLDFSKTKGQIKDMYYFTSGYYDLGDLIVAPVDNYFYGYLFDGDVLASICIFAKGVSYTRASGFLGERYYYLGAESEMEFYSNLEDRVVALYEYSTDSDLGSGYIMEYVAYSEDSSDGNASNHRMYLSQEKRFMERIRDSGACLKTVGERK